jgi:predicted PurR-regulated permease PerM
MDRQHLFKRHIFGSFVGSTFKVTRGKPKNPANSLLLLAAGLVFSLTLAWLGRLVLLLLFAAVVVAILLTSIVDWAMAKLKIGRKLAFALIMLATSSIVILALWISGPNIVEQFASLQVELPQAIQQSVERANGYGWGRWALAHWSSYSQLSSQGRRILIAICVRGDNG